MKHLVDGLRDDADGAIDGVVGDFVLRTIDDTSVVVHDRRQNVRSAKVDTDRLPHCAPQS